MAVVAAALGIVTHATGVFHRTELQTIDARFSIRGAQPSLVRNLVVVGMDQPTLNYFADQHVNHPGVADEWPFPRRYDARVIDNLRNAGAKNIAADIQFTQPTDNTDDLDLAMAVKRAGHMVLATTAVGPHGSTSVLGGNANLRSFGDAVAADATAVPDSDGVLRRMQFSFQGLETFGTAIAARMLGHAVSPKLFGGATATVPIDFAGPPGTVRFISYWKVYTGRLPRLARSRQDCADRRHRGDHPGRPSDGDIGELESAT